MDKSTLNKLKNIEERFFEIEKLMADQNNASDIQMITKLAKEHSELKKVVNLYQDINEKSSQMLDLKQIVKEENDFELIELAKEDISDLEKEIEALSTDLQEQLIPKDVRDKADAIVEVRAGTGGDEASIFAGEIFRMYQRYTELQNWSFKLVDMNDNGLGGIKEVTFEINGSGVFRKMKHEAGTHRVQRVPSTESQGRIHTSAVTVAVLPRLEDINITINQEDIRTDIFHSGGAGGQNVNKVATAVRLTHNPSGIVVTCQRERSQSQNRLIAMDLLKVRLWDLEYQKQQSEHSKNRKDQVGSGDRSEKIRTYNFPQGRITDHRINESVYNLDEFLNGSIDVLIDKLITNDRIESEAETALIFSSRLFQEYFGQRLEKEEIFGKFSDHDLEENILITLNNIISKRSKGVPIQYILDEAWFYGYSFHVYKNDIIKTLIPRNETEFIVEKFIEHSNRKSKNISVIDIGTGSCCIPISIILNSSNINSFDAIDPHTFEIAKKNISSYKLEGRINLYNIGIEGILSNLNKKYDIITANLPYIPEDKKIKALNFEPFEALYAKDDGLHYIKMLIGILPVII